MRKVVLRLRASEGRDRTMEGTALVSRVFKVTLKDDYKGVKVATAYESTIPGTKMRCSSVAR
jgi:hypothetical protein